MKRILVDPDTYQEFVKHAKAYKDKSAALKALLQQTTTHADPHNLSVEDFLKICKPEKP